MANDAERLTKGEARAALCGRLGEHRKVWVSCHRNRKTYWAHVWEDPSATDRAEVTTPVHLGSGHSADRSEAIRMAVESALARLRWAGQEKAEELAASWVNGNRREVLGVLWAMPGFVAAAAALTIAQTLPERELPKFIAAILLVGEAMALQPDDELPSQCEPAPEGEPASEPEPASEREVLRVSISVRG